MNSLYTRNNPTFERLKYSQDMCEAQSKQSWVVAPTLQASPTTKVSISRKTVLQFDIMMVDSDVEYSHK